ncbi:hypothetical protein [Eubacterium sp. AB3007]|uniref:hypothetical protein n=1 Tax=Eubacterium sp. AB3007 TaxID=1392487 RepID=UPI0004882CFC|nr:hypothetical protein [Eubacterium sp. AB3007]
MGNTNVKQTYHVDNTRHNTTTNNNLTVIHVAQDAACTHRDAIVTGRITTKENETLSPSSCDIIYIPGIHP